MPRRRWPVESDWPSSTPTPTARRAIRQPTTSRPPPTPQFTVNQVAVTSASNVVDDVIPGVTLTLRKKDPLASVAIDVAKDNALGDDAGAGLCDGLQ